jgi:hypothetical protein
MGLVSYAARTALREAARSTQHAAARPAAPRMTSSVRPSAAVAVTSPLSTPLSAPSTQPAAVGPRPYLEGNVEIHGADWLDYTAKFFDRYASWPSPEARDGVVLWMAHTYAREAPDNGAGLIFPVTPRLFVLSDERNSGKSTVLRMLSLTCPRVYGIETQPTEYGLLLSIAGEKPTLMIDELGILIGSDKRSANVQQILLNGYTPLGTKLRERKGQIDRVQLFAPIALAGLNVVEKTASENIRAILSRGLIITMRPAPDDAQPADLDDEENAVATAVRRIRLAGMGWTVTNREWLRSYKPEPAEGAYRRWRQIWRPLLAVADGAGRDWPERARAACVALPAGTGGQEQENELADMKAELAANFAGN